MASNDYRLLKEQTDGSFVERNIAAADGKVWGWNNSLDPVAVALPRILQEQNITLNVGNWNLQGGLYEYDYNLSNITDDMVARIIPVPGDYVNFKEADVMPYVLISAGSARFYAVNEPLNNLRVDLQLFEVVNI